ncbi:tol protein [Stagonosporopsis vannaccii]|nr:tol protein [Stagonosporopsis vannaccii]
MVIDCQSRELVQINSETGYVTLSYVWGPDTALMDKDHLHGASLSVLPPTIEDSIRACLELSHRYLWVDRYCISQIDSAERHRQIKRMDTIYANSSLTIVACAGKSPGYGLPGVSRKRSHLRSISLTISGYLQPIPCPEQIYGSIWTSRAWTFQETLLSRRRLYFTDHQLYFEGSNSVECECGTLSGNQTESKTKWIFSPHTWLRNPRDIHNCIENFTLRKLSYPSDALNAMMGIFAVFERRFQVRHLWGIPFSERGSAIWVAALSFQNSLFFATLIDSSRSTTFPSWTWAGWTGNSYWDDYIHMEFSPADICISLELASGRVISWEEYQHDYKSYQQHEHRLSRFIHISANVATVSSVLGSAEDPSGILLANKEVLSFAKRRKEVHWRGRTKYGLGEASLMWFPPPEPTCRMHYLVIRDVGDHWERVGCIMHDDLARHSPPTGVSQTIRLG